MADIVRQLQAARQNLLDLTMRNRLLNFRPTKLKTIQLIDAMPAEIYDSFVLREKAMEFLPRPVMLEDEDTGAEDTKAQDLFAGLEENSTHSDQENASAPQQLPSPEAAGAETHEDRFLRTTLASDELQRRLFYIYQQARSVLEEQGQTILYLAIGFLEWMESPSALQAKRAPLILIPTALERTKVNASFKLRWTGGDLFPNISLQAKLTEQRITLPEFEMPDDKTGIDQYLHSVATIIARMPNWRVVSDCYLDFFSFTKFVMYRDLDPAAWPEGQTPGEHPLMQALLNPSPDTEQCPGFREDEVDEKLATRDVHHVLDADSSQIAVMIAELLVAGKSVLFVSEKMAALEVVKSRLDRVGLGDFCLALHSHKSTKQAVLKELERTISLPTPRPVSLDDQFAQVEALADFCSMGSVLSAATP